MRKLVLLISAAIMASLFTACGQSGELMLPSDPNHDKRPSYLLYHNKQQTTDAVSNDIATDSQIQD
ncbi:hypothetical protein F4V57_04670 [Acinetobacter qingfengensis]|uniref:Lipoprotein n=1 Tax=Acinetobacter qingfengensis TaxID=1262585 RepID=A0A1E7REW9_9GAMM|nr:hypothetical protein [Acinetobacter qingfengensis]KAA8735054.1 hypothetical protein F4V57_04670 [Acinetobacter qingfengensis]OEY97777.1 hypothetical protein BJI46_08465 [Acinetobacter qingfengensis]